MTNLYLAAATDTASMLATFIPLILMIVVFYFLLIRPQGIAGSSDSVLVSGGSKKGRARRRTAHPKPVQPETEKEG